MDLDRWFHPGVEDLGVEAAGGVSLHFACEHDRDLVRPAGRELIGERALKPRAARGGPVEHAGVGDLKLTERELIAVAALAILDRER